MTILVTHKNVNMEKKEIQISNLAHYLQSYLACVIGKLGSLIGKTASKLLFDVQLNIDQLSTKYKIVKQFLFESCLT